MLRIRLRDWWDWARQCWALLRVALEEDMRMCGREWIVTCGTVRQAPCDD